MELTTEILERFRAALRTAGAPLGDAIGPGISDAEIDEVGAQLGVGVPRELRTLWRWGQPTADAATREAGYDVNARYELWAPADAIKATLFYRPFITELANCIAFAGPPQDGCLVVEGNAGTVTSPAFEAYVGDNSLIHDGASLAPSLGTLFALWARQLECGDYTYDGREWHWDGAMP